VVKVKKQGNILFVKGIVMNHHFEKVLKSLEDVARENKTIVIDLGELELIDEYGAEQLFRISNELQRCGYRIELFNAQEKVLTRLLKAGIVPHKKRRQRAG